MKMELKKWDMEYMQDLIRICNEVDRSYLSDRLPCPYTQEDARQWIGMTSEKDGVRGIYRAILVDGEVVGNISIDQKTDVNRKDAEIGAMLAANQWSKGIMTYSVEQMCKLAFEELDIIRITAQVFEPNKASQRVLEKNGFVLEGIMKNAVCKGDNIYDLRIYAKYR
ncbi:MAG: GNAT family N-acetyltransferase [Suilimivivens sp.]